MNGGNKENVWLYWQHFPLTEKFSLGGNKPTTIFSYYSTTYFNSGITAKTEISAGFGSEV